MTTISSITCAKHIISIMLRSEQINIFMTLGSNSSTEEIIGNINTLRNDQDFSTFFLDKMNNMAQIIGETTFVTDLYSPSGQIDQSLCDNIISSL